jgi:hypothetical protein
VALPAPTGRHAVGRLAFDLVDSDRPDPFARRDTPRRLAVWVWYPASRRAGDQATVPYLPGAWRATSWIWGLHCSAVRVHATEGAPPASTDGGFPLVLFSPSANPPLCYTGLLEELASHGYVVAGISHTYEVIPLSVFAEAHPRLFRPASTGGALATPGKRAFELDLRERARVVSVKADDLDFVRARLVAGTGALFPPIDASRTAAIGHSFGGGAAAELCGRQAGPKAGASIDGGLWRTPDSLSTTAPFLQLFAAHPEYSSAPETAVEQGFFRNPEYATEDRATTVGAWQALHEAARPGYAALVRGASHTAFCDWPMLPLRPWSPARRALRGVTGPGVCRTVARSLLAFLGRHLRGADVDVAGVLESEVSLRRGDPAELFAVG